MDLNTLQQRLREFSGERDWTQFHTPRNLTLALVGEVGELAELMQWKTDAQLVDSHADDPRALADELADVLIYVCQIANALNIDLPNAVESKMAINAQRYPIDRVRGRAVKYTELGQ